MQGFMPRAVTVGITIEDGCYVGHSRNYLYFCACGCRDTPRGGSLLYNKAPRGTGVGSYAQKERFQKGNKGGY